MRIESSVTSISWIPSEAIQDIKSQKLVFDLGVAQYDPPPPDRIDSLDRLNRQGRFRFANRLRAWIDVEDGKIRDYGYNGRSYIGSTAIRLGPAGVNVPAVALPDIQRMPQVRESSVRFVQSAGGRTGVPVPRSVRGKPFVQLAAPLAWTTLEVTIHADGTVRRALVGASRFPRHWVYDDNGDLVAKSGLIDFTSWFRESYKEHSPWGYEDSPAVVTAAESALERHLSSSIMNRGSKPAYRRLTTGQALVRQGEPGGELFLLLDGVMRIDVDGVQIAEVGPGSILGERSFVEGGSRTSTLVAVTGCRLAVVPAGSVRSDVLMELAAGHRREEQIAAGP